MRDCCEPPTSYSSFLHIFEISDIDELDIQDAQYGRQSQTATEIPRRRVHCRGSALSFRR